MGRTMVIINLLYPDVGPAGWWQFPDAGIDVWWSMWLSRCNEPCKYLDDPFVSTPGCTGIGKSLLIERRRWQINHLHCILLPWCVLVPRLHTQMAMPTMHAQTTSRPLTAIRTNQVRSSPRNRVGSWLWHNVPMASSLPSAQWLTPSQTRLGWMQNAARVQRKSLHACSVGGRTD